MYVGGYLNEWQMDSSEKENDRALGINDVEALGLRRVELLGTVFSYWQPRSIGERFQVAADFAKRAPLRRAMCFPVD